jgi:DNA-binding SARP family transcriptional activator
MTPLCLTLFGGFEVRLGSVPLGLPTKRAQALLAYLAVRPGQAHPRDKLAALLWGDRSDAQARHSLRQTLFTLRKLLGPSGQAGVIREHDGIALEETAVDVDVVTFERLAATTTPEELERAARLYQGDFLAGLSVNEPAFEQWLLVERERLREVQLEVLARLLAHQTKAGAIANAIQTAVGLLALDPLQEVVHRTLMRLFQQHGRRAAALRQYQICLGVLQQELGVEPEQETKRLYREILLRTHERGTPLHVARRRPGDRRRAARPSRAVGSVSGVPLVGRESELSWLRRGLARTLDGRGQLVILIGEAGVGKSRMVEELAAEARERGTVVLVGRCYEAARVLAFGPWVDALRPAIAGMEADYLAAVRPLWRAELARLFPELADPETAPPDPQDSLRLFEAVEQFLVYLASRQPLVVVLEDLHWADDSSLRLLFFLARRIEARTLLLLTTAREEELIDAPFAKRVFDELAGESRLDRLALPPLSRAETTQLVHLLVGRRDGSSDVDVPEDRIWALSDGNPFVVVEAARAFRERGVAGGPALWSLPPRVQDVIATRLDRLSDRAQHLVAVAAVIGREFDFGLLRRAAGLGEAEAADAVEELVRRRIFQTVGERLDFTHDRLREAAYGRLLKPRRQLIHRLVGRALEDFHGAVGSDPCSAALAIHFSQAEDWDKTLSYFKEAGTQALARAAHREAAALYEQGLQALQFLPAAIETMKQRLELLFQLRNALLPLGDLVRTAQCLREAAQIATCLDDQRALGRASSYLARYCLQVRDHSGAIEHGRRALSLAASLGDPQIELPANLYLGVAHHVRGEYREAVDYQTRVIAATQGPYARERVGLPYCPSVLSRAFLAWSLAELGRFRQATAEAREACALAEAIDQPWELLVGHWACGLVELIRGSVQPAISSLERSRELCAAREFPTWGVQIDSALGCAYALAGRLTDGLPLLEKVLESAGGTTIHHTRALGRLAEGYLTAGQHEEGVRIAQMAVQLARESGERGYEAYALHTLGEIDLARAELESADRHTRQSLCLAEGMGMLPLAARCQFTLGRLGHLSGHSGARGHLETAAAMSREMQMWDWGEKVETELTASKAG